MVPWIVVPIGPSVGGFLLRVGRRLGRSALGPRYTVSFAALWLICAACLVAIYVTQEFLEGLFATGHPRWVGIFGYGGWWSIPAALAVGSGAGRRVPRRTLGAAHSRRHVARSV